MTDLHDRSRPGRPGVLILFAMACLFLGGEAVASAQQLPPTMRVDLERAIQLALAHNHALQAARTQVTQSKANEMTASLRPNPVFTWNDFFLPVFTPSQLNGDYLNNASEFDLLFSYTFERGRKRKWRMQNARDNTAVVQSQVQDNERALSFNVAQQFVNVLLAESSLTFAQQNLESFQQTLDVSQERYQKGAISEGDLLKIRLQRLQFQEDVSSAKLARQQALDSLRDLLGYESVPQNYDVAGNLAYAPIQGSVEDFQAKALNLRPDLRAANQAVVAANSNYRLAKANGKRDLTLTSGYSHVSAANDASFSVNMEIPLYDRNQGEIARTHAAITQSEETKNATQQAVMTDVATAYEAVRTGERIVQLYQSGYLKDSKESLDISQYAYQRGAASLLDFLDAERSYRSIELAYRATLATYMLAVDQLHEAVGARPMP
ncbi:MAG: TolC family protein [Acidobacteria bacterium]|nr:MAG: TolC family protein [Acidobacteriota bacterium]